MADFEWLAPGGHQRLVDEVVDRLDLKADIDGYYAQLTAGAADNLTARGDATAAEFLYRTAGGTADIETGQAVAKSVKGNTLVWNQLFSKTSYSNTNNGVTATNNNDGTVTIDGTATSGGNVTVQPNHTIIADHKYLIKGGLAGGSSSTYFLNVSGLGRDYGSGDIFTYSSTAAASIRYTFAEGDTFDNMTFTPQFFDLTAMFGAGSEPSTIEEFTALYPLPYYEYDAGSLLSVNMEGIETVGFNQWDEVAENGSISNTTGENGPNASYLRSKNYVPVFPGMVYYFKTATPLYVYAYDANKGFVSLGSVGYRYMPTSTTFTVPANVHYVRISWAGTTYNNDICINLSDPTRNGEYEPFWKSERTIPAATYFPNGMRSAGTVYDELMSDAAVTRVGAVDLGTLEWTMTEAGKFRATKNSILLWSTLMCVKYDSYAGQLADMPDKSISATNSQTTLLLRVYDSAYTDAATFKAAMSGVMLHYALATPTTTPIDPPLNMTYRTAQGGTERVMVPTGEQSAPPTLVTAQGYTAESLRDAALSAIAPIENGVASTNYGVGSYLVHGGQLCRVTTAIATGESISIGTNVTATTVMAEVIALIAQ